MSAIGYKAIFLAVTASLLLTMTGVASAVVSLEPGDVNQEIGAFSYAGEWEGLPGGETVNVSQLGAYLHAGYGIAENWEAFFRIGGADLVIEKGFADNQTDFSGELRPFGTLGVRGSLVRTQYFDLGIFADASYFADYSDEQTGYMSGDSFPGFPPDLVAVQEEITISQQWSANLGVTAALKFEGVSLYVGPVAYWRQANFDSAKVTVDGDQFRSGEQDALTESGNVGLVGGIEIALGSIGLVKFEAQQKSDLSLSGAFSYLQFSF